MWITKVRKKQMLDGNFRFLSLVISTKSNYIVEDKGLKVVQGTDELKNKLHAP